MRCPNCGSEAQGNFCTNCGTKIETPPPEPVGNVKPKKKRLPPILRILIGIACVPAAIVVLLVGAAVIDVLFSGDGGSDNSEIDGAVTATLVSTIAPDKTLKPTKTVAPTATPEPTPTPLAVPVMLVDADFEEDILGYPLLRITVFNDGVDTVDAMGIKVRGEDALGDTLYTGVLDGVFGDNALSYIFKEPIRPGESEENETWFSLMSFINAKNVKTVYVAITEYRIGDSEKVEIPTEEWVWVKFKR